MKRISIPSTKRIGEDMLMLFHFDRRKKSEKEKKPPRFLVLRRKWLTLGAAVLAAAAIFAAVNYPAAVSASAATRQLPIYCVQRDQKVCSISFDAAWGADNTQKILDVLKEYGVTCTFFVVGNWADQCLVFDDNGLTVVFNPYTIAPYATGELSYLIPYSLLQPYLNGRAMQLLGLN